MIVLSILYLILRLILFLLGLVFGIIILILILFLISIRKIPKESKFKKKQVDDDGSKKSNHNDNQDEKIFNFEESSQLTWMNRLIWRAYPLLLDRHYIKVTIMQAFDQIPKDIPNIKKLKLSQFKTGMTPLILDNASIHIIPQSHLDDILNSDKIHKSNSSNLINFQEQQLQQQPYSIIKKQRSFLGNTTPLEMQITHSKSSTNITNNPKQANLNENKSQTKVVDNSNESLPPGFSIIKKIVEGNKNCSDYLKFCFHFEPDLEIGAEVELAIRLLGTIPVAANFKLHSLNGHFIVAIPPKSGRLSIGILESTNINFDITAQLGVISFNSEEWKSTWNSLKNWIHYFIHKIVINIPLEENLQNMVESENNKDNEIKEMTDKDYEKEKELMLKKIQERKKQKNNVSQNKKPIEKVADKPSEVPQNSNIEKTNIENSNKNQKQLITFKHYMTLWDYEF